LNSLLETFAGIGESCLLSCGIQLTQAAKPAVGQQPADELKILPQTSTRPLGFLPKRQAKAPIFSRKIHYFE
jgi:hypothetical protein